ncbi:MAG: NADH-quinone oxidoreductase subunit NuoN [Campylobacter sp.]|nr:NADH-quinone oxidoreductase subunit NuoN [Campylobacter sp.]
MLNKLTIDINLLNLASISPAVSCIIFAVILLCISMVKKELEPKFYAVVTLLALIVSLGLMFGYKGPIRGFFDMVLVDGISHITNVIITLVSAIFVLYTLSCDKFDDFKRPEFYVLFLFMISGFGLMTSSDSLVLIIVALELSSLCLYTLIAMRNTVNATSAAIKYFVMGAVGSACFVLGAALIYLVSGSLEIGSIVRNLALSEVKYGVTMSVGIVLIIVALGFKIALAPFHTWLGDIYSGATSSLAAYVSIVPKLAAFAVALRLFNALIVIDVFFIEITLYIVAVATMSIANVAALVQDNVKRMLAYSSISHAGFLLTAILIGSSQATMGMFLYWIMFCIANLGAFGVLLAYENKDGRAINFSNFKGLINKNSALALSMSVFMFSLAGIPPLSVFWGKMVLLSSAVNSGLVILAVIMALNSAIAMYYYLRLVVTMLLSDEDDNTTTYSLNLTLKWVIYISAVVCLVSPFIVKFAVPKIYALILFSGF